MNRTNLLSLLAVVLSAAGCASSYRSYWGRNGVDQPVPVARDAPVWIWTSEGVEKWHAVVITRDSVSGIPYKMSVHCDSCWRSIPRARVDSLKVGYERHRPTALEFVGLVGAGILLDGVLCYLFDRNDPQC